MKTEKINFRLSPKQLEQLQQIAADLKIPLSAFIRWALQAGTKQAEHILNTK
jgi:predicted DNA binding CopG/RHH family protein